MGKLLAYIRKVLVIAILTGAVGQWLVQFRKAEDIQPGSVSSFFDALATSPARKQPRELIQILNSEQFSNFEYGDKLVFLQDMVQAFIRPNLDDQQALRTRGAFIAAIAGIIFDVSNSDKTLIA